MGLVQDEGDYMEQVLVFKRADLDSLGSFQGISTDSKYANLLEDTFFMDRDKAEEDPNFKQVIPYILIRDQRGHYFRYQRTKKVGEQRLAKNYSVGIGGHLNQSDLGFPCHEKSDWFGGIYNIGRNREIKEEIEFLNNNWYNAQIPSDEWYNVTRIGFLNDDSNPVGSVHFAVLEMLTLIPGISIELEDDALTDGKMDNLGNISKLNLENWSRIVVDRLIDESFQDYYCPENEDMNDYNGIYPRHGR